MPRPATRSLRGQCLGLGINLSQNFADLPGPGLLQSPGLLPRQQAHEKCRAQHRSLPAIDSHQFANSMSRPSGFSSCVSIMLFG